MSVRILEGTYDGRRPGACMVDSTTGQVFGPLLRDYEEAEAFLAWLPDDPRCGFLQLDQNLRRFRAEREAG